MRQSLLDLGKRREEYATSPSPAGGPHREIVRVHALQATGVARRPVRGVDDVSKAADDPYGNAMGGVRSPVVDVPLVDYAVHAEGGPVCLLGGGETPLPPSALADRYPSLDAYLAEFTRSLDATIEAGFLREKGRAAILADARAKAGPLLAPDPW
jgi:hypothetical protein